MDALVVIHMGLEETLMAMPPDLLEAHALLCGRIAQEVDKYIKPGKRAYYLSEHGSPPNPRLIHSLVLRHLPKMTYVPLNGTYEQQLLRTKELLINDKAVNVSLSGVAYDSCVSQLYRLFLGRFADALTSSIYERYERESRKLGWPKEKFDRIFNQEFAVGIRVDLTDKALQSTYKL